MAWDGYFTLDGYEIINVSRTEALAAGQPWFKPVHENPALAPMLGEDEFTYAAPSLAPWYDPDQPASLRFFGFYPLNITGLEDSSRSSQSVESTGEGGVPGRVRHGMKTLVFNGLLLAADPEAAEFGMRWLKRALLGPLCAPLLASDTVLGATLTYLGSAPVWEPNPSVGQTPQYRQIGRTLRRVVFNSGPNVLAKVDDLSCGGSAWNVQFTAVSGVPYEFGLDRAILQGYLDPLVADPWVPGVEQGATSQSGYTEVECGDNLWTPIYDPLCAALIVPPAPPSVPLACYAPGEDWQRYMVTIPDTNIPLIGEVVPLLEISTTAESRNVRLRFYADPDGDFDPTDDPCEFVGDVVISYIPTSSSIILDGTTEEVFVITAANQRRRADSLVFRTDGKPFKWPALTCGYQYILTVDVPIGADPPVIDLSFVHRAA
jgi:hypothetical protein